MSQLVEQGKPLNNAWEQLNTEAHRREAFHTAERDKILDSSPLKNRNPYDVPTKEVAAKLHEAEIHHKAATEAQYTQSAYKMYQGDRHAYNIMEGRKTADQHRERIQERQEKARVQAETRRQELEEIQ